MKLSIIMAAGAGLAAATPLRVRQTESKRPFVQPADDNDLAKCGNVLFLKNTEYMSEECAGTLEYCQKGYYAKFDESFGSAEECVASREPAPLKPFKQPDDSVQSCGNPSFRGNTEYKSEACVGTLNYCQKGYYTQFKESFSSAKECVASREPAPLKPFKQPDNSINSVKSCGNTKGESEACVGTLEYCQKGYYAQFNESFGSAEECVASRESALLKPFKQPDNSVDSCGIPSFRGNTQGHSEPCVGTVMYCSKGYWAEYKEESFASEEECLKARNPAHKPAPAPPSVPTPQPTPEPESKPTPISASESASESVTEPTPEPAPVQTCIPQKEDEDR
ncbi:hypothetical protein G3M48_008534 [Beauveria asiatica]|uniref:Uncharacterized protein n=1 Tax=Beauveria asiatica TaxID=1069075 RepID=A0AAW0RKT4_9HYPO